MKKRMLLFTGLLLLGLSGCIPSLHPLYTLDTIFFDADLLGTWHEQSGGTWTFKANKDPSYEVSLVNEDQKERDTFTVYMVKLDDHFFLDFVRKDREEYFAPYLPTHSFAKIEKNGKDWVIRTFNGDFLEKLIKNRKIRIKHEVLDNDQYLLTASTEELQEFFRKFATEPEAFDEPTTLTREL
ncbi:MAG TPA: hypothetical protein PKE06_23330 [Flavilitoribacter sp.]|nr:hypothetical protein [Flavilitoribacter sp.]HMQ90951.1 hypothetical protein [Flavilitoribacter sp.]